jgi:hypothetical protein
MNRTAIISAVGLALAVALGAAPAQAQAVRTFVSGHGSDTGTCGVGSPCRTFAYAITQTRPLGEITVLDSAGYGPVTVTQSVLITSPVGVEAAITTTTSGQNAITINTGVDVTLRGLTLVNGGGGNDGIRFTGDGALNVQNCLITGFTGDGIDFIPSNNATLDVSDTIVFGNTGSGVVIAPTGGATVAIFERVQTILNGFGGFTTGNGSGGTVVATVTDSTAIKNSSFGFWVAEGTFAIVNSRVVGNDTGMDAYQTGAVISLANTTMSGNATGFYVASGTIDTFRNNNIMDTNNFGSLTTVNQR